MSKLYQGHQSDKTIDLSDFLYLTKERKYEIVKCLGQGGLW